MFVAEDFYWCRKTKCSALKLLATAISANAAVFENGAIMLKAST